MKKYLLIMSMVSFPFLSRGQDTTKESNHNESPPRHSLGIAIGHAQSFEGRDENNERKTLALPCWSLEYNYQLNEKWALGLHTDFIIQKFSIEASGDDNLTERSYPVAPTIMALHNVSPHWELQIGTGIEFAKEENLFLIRAGVEYGVELPEEWEVFGSLCYDIKWDTYRTLTIGLGISKRINFR